jgi:hypothetical protein
MDRIKRKFRVVAQRRTWIERGVMKDRDDRSLCSQSGEDEWRTELAELVQSKSVTTAPKRRGHPEAMKTPRSDEDIPDEEVTSRMNK